VSQHLYTETGVVHEPLPHTTVLHHSSKNNTGSDGFLHSLVFGKKDSNPTQNFQYQESNPTVIRRDSSEGEFAALAPLSSERYRLNEQYNQMMLADDSREGI
jgi:hypothetical protein